MRVMLDTNVLVSVIIEGVDLLVTGDSVFMNVGKRQFLRTL